MKKITRALAALSFFIILITDLPGKAVLDKDYKGENNPGQGGKVWLKLSKYTTYKNQQINYCIARYHCDPRPDKDSTFAMDNCPLWVKGEYCIVHYEKRKKENNPYFLELRNGKLYRFNSKIPYDSVKDCEKTRAEGVPLNTDCTTKDKEYPPTIWVMDLKGNLYVGPVRLPGHFHHSSFLAGEPVICAGEIIIENGSITYLNKESGHYKPDREAFKEALTKLKENGYPIEKIDYLDGETRCTKKKCKILEYVEYEFQEGGKRGGYGVYTRP